MGEEVKIGDYEAGGEEGAGDDDDDDDRVLEWEFGLPSADDLTPLSQPLIPPELASAFSITPEPCRTMLEVSRASQDTLSSLQGQSLQQQAPSSNDFNFNFKSFSEDSDGDKGREAMVVEGGDDEDLAREGSDSMRKLRKIGSGGVEEDDSILRTAAENCTDDSSARTLKRPRLVWTPQLHKRFVDVVAHLGIKNAVPKTIMQLMNVEGLTRENVASHLQKYRLYLKRMQGLSSEGPSSSDHLFASTPVPQSLHESSGGGGGSTRNGHNYGHVPVPVTIPMPYPPQMIPMPVLGMAHGHGHMAMPVGNSTTSGPYPGFESLHSYNMVQQRDWSGNKFGSVASYHNGTSNEK